MTRARYDRYRGVLTLLEGIGFAADERAVLRDAAEGMLLARSADSSELELLLISMSLALDRAVLGKRVTRTAADSLKARIEQCGPVREPVPA